MPITHTLARNLRQLRDHSLDFLFTPRCAACQREGAYLCSSCLAKVRALAGPYHPSALVTTETGACIIEPTALDGVYAPYAMEGVVREAIHQLKYQGVRDIAPTLSQMMAEHIGRERLTADAVVPVPLHASRLRQRGYNQADLLAREIARATGLPLRTDLVERRAYAGPQARSSSQGQRWSQMRGAFQARPAASGMRILLIDDVCTTGATLNACAQALREAWSDSVIGLTAAREI